MPVRPIPQIGDPVLRRATAAVDPVSIDSDDIQALIADLIDTMTAAGGSGIAANQIGVSLAVCVIGVTKNARYPYKPPIPLTVMINPRVQLLDDEQWLNNEGCLSVPLRGDLPRHMNIEVSAFDRNGESFTETYRGLTAGTVQHEVDHLNGGLIVDRMEDSRTMTTWENFAEHGMDSYLERIAPVIARTEPKVVTDG